MTTAPIAITRPVAMQRGRCRDRRALAQLRLKRRWLLRRRHKATLALSGPPPGTANPRIARAMDEFPRVMASELS